MGAGGSLTVMNAGGKFIGQKQKGSVNSLPGDSGQHTDGWLHFHLVGSFLSTCWAAV